MSGLNVETTMKKFDLNPPWTPVILWWLAMPGCALIGYDALDGDGGTPQGAYGETKGGLADAASPSFAGPDAEALPTGGLDAETTAADANLDRDGDDGWWNTDYLYRRRLTLDNDDPGNEALSEFPLLVTLLDERTPTSNMAADGADLRFVDADDQTLLPFEVEFFDAAATGLIWVQVPLVDADSATDHIYMYYGNDSPAAVSASANTWNSSYQAVFHMNGNADDSTGNGFNGSINGPSSIPSGRIGRAYDFDGVDDYINLGTNQPWLRDVDAWSLEAWVQATSINPSAQSADGNWVVSISVADAFPSIDSRATIGLQNRDELGMLARAADGDMRDSLRTSDGSIALNQWHYIVATVDYPGDLMSLYVDGNLAATGNATFDANTSSDTNSRSASIGAEDDASGEFFVGRIDEVRVSTTRHSDWWIKAQHKSMIDETIDYGPEEVRP